LSHLILMHVLYFAGPVTNAIGVKLLRKYFEYIHTSVENSCNWEDKTQDLECAYKVNILLGQPQYWQFCLDC